MAKNYKKSAERFSAAKAIYDNIVAALEKGEIIWCKPWVNSEMPCNAISKRPYHGYNAFFLNFISELKGYDTNRFLTYNQAKDLGGNVRKGERGNMIVFTEVKAEMQKDKDGTPQNDEDGNPIYRRFFISRYYTVFNIAQCENLPESIYTKESFDTLPIKSGEDIIKGYDTMPPLEMGGDTACYIPSRDIIKMPLMEHFKTAEGYYSTLFHECVHSTGAKNRLNRDLSGIAVMGGESADKYAREELIAEIGAAMLCNACGIPPQIENAAAYCQSWLKAIHGMKDTALMGAFTQAWKAAEYIQGRKAATTETKGEDKAA